LKLAAVRRDGQTANLQFTKLHICKLGKEHDAYVVACRRLIRT
jgi:hypothetical protein